MEQPQYIVDAFTDAVFSGNPAAVCPLDDWLPDATMAAIARENNLSETAFIVGARGAYAIRWFTPSMEVDLCGHATLASAFVVFNYLEPNRTAVSFQSPSGPLRVERRGDRLVLDFPARPGDVVECPPALVEGLGVSPLATFLSRDYLVIVDSHKQVAQCQPAWPLLQDLPSLGIIVSAPGTDCDFVSRVFFPTDSILEDPVTGSAHCTLIPYWAARLGKHQLHARQISARGGELFCEMAGERVYIGGRAVLFSKAHIFL
ncbi:MAG: PhzF family phenazine biosynthesis protein [Candidatus Latescibacterota bacterium]|nr:PhzF family phenazine biosynthesis protein [Candidatus Latescibacterota bacterium]